MNAQRKMSKEIKNLWKFYSPSDDEYNYLIDFSGFIMKKSSYGDVNSSFGWNEDHVFPRNFNGNYKGSNNFENVQPIGINTNTQKSNNIEGKVIHKYIDKNNCRYTVVTEYEVCENIFYPSKSRNNINGIIFIKSQWVQNGNSRANEKIRNIYFIDSCGYFLKDNIFLKSELDIEKSFNKNILIFKCGQDPTKWKKAKRDKYGNLIQ